MKTRELTFLLIITAFLLAGCNRNKENPGLLEKTKVFASGFLLADTIIYDVIIKSTDPYDPWMNQSLGKLKHKNLIDSIFDMVYAKELIAYDYFTNKEMSLKDIRDIENEEDFNRQTIGKIQFAEAWYFNRDEGRFIKEIISVTLGHEIYEDSGELRGYRPIFKVYLNP